MLRLLVFVVLCSCGAVLLQPFGVPPAHAQSEQSPDQRSAAFAQEAEQLLRSGDPEGAVRAALKGLPEAPSAEDLARLSRAHDALFRAVSARTFTVDRSGPQYLAFASTGERAIAGGINSQSGQVEDIDPYSLYDARTGALIADLEPAATGMSAVYSPSEPPAISPDGGLIALWAMEEGEVRLFRAGMALLFPV